MFVIPPEKLSVFSVPNVKVAIVSTEPVWQWALVLSIQTAARVKFAPIAFVFLNRNALLMPTVAKAKSATLTINVKTMSNAA